MALEPGAGEYSLVDSAEREVDDRRQVGVVAALKFLEGFVRKREGGKETERSGQAGARVGERLQHRSDLLQFLHQILFGLVDGVDGQCTEFAQLVGGLDELVPIP